METDRSFELGDGGGRVDRHLHSQRESDLEEEQEEDRKVVRRRLRERRRAVEAQRKGGARRTTRTVIVSGPISAELRPTAARARKLEGAFP